MLRLRLLALAVGLVMLATAAPAAAATIVVNTKFDDTGQGDGQCSLRKAIADVDSPGTTQSDCTPAAFGANTIALPAGDFLLGFAGQLNVVSTVSNLTIAGAGESTTTIDGNGSGSRVLNIASGASVTLQNLTIANGRAPAGQSGAPASGAAGQGGANGGGILNQGNLSMVDGAVTGSNAGTGGDGGTGGSPASTDGGPGGTGGAGGSGGGIYNTGVLNLNGITFANDHAGNGGVGAAGGQGTNGGASGNGGTGGNGGAIDNAGGTLIVTNSTLRGSGAGNGGFSANGGSANTTTGGAAGTGGAGGAGGGISSDGGSLSVTNATFASDSAGTGGSAGNGGAAPASGGVGGAGGAGGKGGAGGAVSASGASSATLLQVTIAGSDAGAGGNGGSGGNGGTAGAAGATGASGSGGAVFAQGGSVTLQNSLLAQSQGGNCAGMVLDGGYNLSSGDASCPGTFAAGDPNLGALQSNGGPAATISLQTGSAAIDKIPASGANCPATDERGVPRPSGPRCDIGAYEVAPPVAKTGAVTKINKTFVTLNGVVTPNAGTASVAFQYGTSPKLGSTSPIEQESGVAPIPVAIRVLQLKPKRTYFYRLVVAAMDGTSYGALEKFSTTAVPVIAHLAVSPPSFHRGAEATIGYTDSLAGKTAFVVLRCVAQRRGRCVRTRRAGSFTHLDKKGRNSVPFNGRIGRVRLGAGSYLLEATPHAPVQGATVSARFSVT